MGSGGRPVMLHRSGLAGFEAPRFVHVEEPVAAETGSPDDLIRGQALIGRALLAVALVGTAPALDRDPDLLLRVGWLIALVWLPVVALLDLAHRRWRIRRGPLLDLLWDVALLATIAITVDAPGTAIVGYVLVTGFHAYVGGHRSALMSVAVCTGAALVTQAGSGRSVDLHQLIVGVLAMSLIGWLLADAARRQHRSRAGLVHISEKADAILAGIADAVIVTSPSGVIQEWNPAASRTFAWSEHAVQRSRCTEVLALHQGLRPLACDAGCALLLARSHDTSVEVWRRDAMGRRQPLLASATAILGSDGLPLEVIHSFRDIATLKAADEAKTMFLSTASHELKTPLTVIHGFAQMLRRDGMPEAERRLALEAIESRTAQLSGIVDRLLMSSRIDAGQIDLDLGMLDVAPIAEERGAAIQAALGRPIVIASRGALPAAYADADAVTTVVDHLLDNAVKYSPDGGAITLGLGATADGTELVISVTDSGVGMTPEQLEHCFDRFWQADASDARRFAGSGMGLYIVRSLVEAMHGTVTAESRPARGSTFKLRLRTAVAERTADDEPDPISPPKAQSSMIREYMRQVGVPLQGVRDSG